MCIIILSLFDFGSKGLNFEYLSKHTILASCCIRFHVNTSAFSLPEFGDTVYSIHTPWAVATSQPGTADIPDFPQTICHHYAVALNAAVFRPNAVYDPFSHPPAFEMILTSHHF